MLDVKCYCGEPFVEKSMTMQTLVGYDSPKGHDHDDNCVTATYTCAGGHKTKLGLQRRCHAENCDWVGKTMCKCHSGPKLAALPEVKLTVEDQKLFDKLSENR